MPLKFFDVNLPFGVADVDYEEGKPYFEQTVSVVPGMLLDCKTVFTERTMILFGHVNLAMGTCACCCERITFVYRYAVIPLPKS